MKSGKEIVELWERMMRFEIDEKHKQELVDLIEAGLNEAYEAGQLRVIELARRQLK